MTKKFVDEYGASIIVEALRLEMKRLQKIIDNNTEALQELDEDIILYGGSATEVMPGGNEP